MAASKLIVKHGEHENSITKTSENHSKIYILGTNQRVEVYNMIGELVYGPFNATSINISDWESEVYFVKSGLSVVKIIKH